MSQKEFLNFFFLLVIWHTLHISENYFTWYNSIPFSIKKWIELHYLIWSSLKTCKKKKVIIVKPYFVFLECRWRNKYRKGDMEPPPPPGLGKNIRQCWICTNPGVWL